jgi:hypothetical protein
VAICSWNRWTRIPRLSGHVAYCRRKKVIGRGRHGPGAPTFLCCYGSKRLRPTAPPAIPAVCGYRLLADTGISSHEGHHRTPAAQHRTAGGLIGHLR